MEENVFCGFDGGGQHELRAVGANEFRRLIDQCSILRAGARVDIDLGGGGSGFHGQAMDICGDIVNTKRSGVFGGWAGMACQHRSLIGSSPMGFVEGIRA